MSAEGGPSHRAAFTCGGCPQAVPKTLCNTSFDRSIPRRLWTHVGLFPFKDWQSQHSSISLQQRQPAKGSDFLLWVELAKPCFHSQTRRMGCSAKYFFTGGAAALHSQPESGKAAPGDAEHLLKLPLHRKRSPQRKQQHRQNLPSSGPESLARTIFPSSSINLCSAFFQTTSGEQKPPQAQGVTMPMQIGLHPCPPGRVLGEVLLLSSISHQGTPPLSSMFCGSPHPAGFSEGCSAPQQCLR